MGARIRFAIQLLAPVPLYCVLIWLTALTVTCAQGGHVSHPLIVFGIIHAAEAVALVSLALAMVRYPYAYFPFLILNLMFIVATIVMSALILTRTLDDAPYQKLSTSALSHVFLASETIVALALEFLVGMEVNPLTQSLLNKRRNKRPKSKPADKGIKRESRETLKKAPARQAEAPTHVLKPVKTVDDMNLPDRIVEIQSDEMHGEPEHEPQSPQRTLAVNELKVGSDFERELARALLT